MSFNPVGLHFKFLLIIYGIIIMIHNRAVGTGPAGPATAGPFLQEK